MSLACFSGLLLPLGLDVTPGSKFEQKISLWKLSADHWGFWAASKPLSCKQMAELPDNLVLGLLKAYFAAGKMNVD